MYIFFLLLFHTQTCSRYRTALHSRAVDTFLQKFYTNFTTLVLWSYFDLSALQMVIQRLGIIRPKS